MGVVEDRRLICLRAMVLVVGSRPIKEYGKLADNGKQAQGHIEFTYDGVPGVMENIDRWYARLTSAKLQECGVQVKDVLQDQEPLVARKIA